MSRTKKLSFSAMIAALCVIFLAGSLLLPRVTLSLAAFAGLFPAAVVIVCGYGWAACASAAAAALALLLLPDKTAGLWFLFFFGHYPIWKALIERWQTDSGLKLAGWALKLLGFALCMTLLFFLFRAFFVSGIPYAFTEYAAGPYIILLLLPLAFVLYDIAFSILIGWFRIRILPKIK